MRPGAGKQPSKSPRQRELPDFHTIGRHVNRLRRQSSISGDSKQFPAMPGFSRSGGAALDRAPFARAEKPLKRGEETMLDFQHEKTLRRICLGMSVKANCRCGKLIGRQPRPVAQRRGNVCRTGRPVKFNRPACRPNAISRLLKYPVSRQMLIAILEPVVDLVILLVG